MLTKENKQYKKINQLVKINFYDIRLRDLNFKDIENCLTFQIRNKIETNGSCLAINNFLITVHFNARKLCNGM